MKNKNSQLSHLISRYTKKVFLFSLIIFILSVLLPIGGYILAGIITGIWWGVEDLLQCLAVFLCFSLPFVFSFTFNANFFLRRVLLHPSAKRFYCIFTPFFSSALAQLLFITLYIISSFIISNPEFGFLWAIMLMGGFIVYFAILYFIGLIELGMIRWLIKKTEIK